VRRAYTTATDVVERRCEMQSTLTYAKSGDAYLELHVSSIYVEMCDIGDDPVWEVVDLPSVEVGDLRAEDTLYEQYELLIGDERRVLEALQGYPSLEKHYVFPEGVVVLDIDAPTEYYHHGSEGRSILIERAEALCDELSEKYELGQYWLYHTKTGLHAIFERRVESWIEVLWEAEQREGFRECGGHASVCRSNGFATLRVSRKEGRGWDIYPVEGYDVDTNVPLHVRGHRDALLSNLRPW
jgi:hypothetical protein